ncbi:SpoIIE family protein phosphatase [Streptomyces sp. cg36]|uniref:SpoIIE family protein phosphatase n=1 Tax=Streptomyces sp. cg36 TaxID=3238798 RepID=UPI0034E1D299
MHRHSDPADPAPGTTADLTAQAFEGAPGGLAVLDRHGRELLTNPQWARLLGPAPREAGDICWTDRLPAEHHRAARTTLHRAFHAVGASAEQVLHLPTPPDPDRAVLLSVRRADTAEYCVAQVSEVGDEITERRTQLRLALRTASLAVWSIDLVTGDERWFDGSEELYGLRLGTAPIGAQLEAATAPEHLDAVRDAFTRAVNGADTLEATYAMHDDSGALRWMRIDARVHLLSHPPRRWLVGITRDITDETARRGALEDRARNEADRATRIEKVAASLVSATTTQGIACALTDGFHQELNAIGALVVVPDSGVLRPLAASGAGGPAGEVMDGLPVDSAVPAAHVIRTGQPCFIASHQEFRELSDGDPHGLLSRTQARSWAVLPLDRGSREPGALVLGYARTHTFPPEERSLLLTVAGLTGQALERSALVQDRVDLAHAVQQVMMPAALPDLPGLRLAGRYVPARGGIDVGGDWYDAFPLPDGRYGLCIGDVEGHDVRAAAAMGQARTAVRAYAQTEATPGDVLAKANDLFCALTGSHFATCTYVVIDPRADELTAATAGHVPGVLGLMDGSSVLLAPPPGPPLGILPGSRYGTIRRPLTLIRTLSLFSDGLVEGPQVTLDSGLQRVRRITAENPRADADELAEALLATAQLTGHLDDAALLTLRREDPGTTL